MSEMRRTLPLFLCTLFLWVAAASAATDQAANVPPSGGINAVLKANRANTEPDFLPPDQAFQVAAFEDGADRVKVQWAIHEGYYLYKSRIKFATASKDAQLGAPSLPKGKPKHDDYFGDQEVYHDSLEASVSVARKAGAGKLTLPLDVT